MGREVRRVPADWKHPEDEHGQPVPTLNHFTYSVDEIVEGIADGWLVGGPPNYGCATMPDWPDSERTHWQMYETCSEGTPISPVMESPEALARWLADNEASAFGDRTATYEQWLTMIKRGSAVSAVFVGGHGLISGVE